MQESCSLPNSHCCCFTLPSVALCQYRGLHGEPEGSSLFHHSHDNPMQIDLLVACSQIFLIAFLDLHLLPEVPERKLRYIKILDPQEQQDGWPSASSTLTESATFKGRGILEQ